MQRLISNSRICRLTHKNNLELRKYDEIREMNSNNWHILEGISRETKWWSIFQWTLILIVKSQRVKFHSCLVQTNEKSRYGFKLLLLCSLILIKTYNFPFTMNHCHSIINPRRKKRHSKSSSSKKKDLFIFIVLDHAILHHASATFFLIFHWKNYFKTVISTKCTMQFEINEMVSIERA